MPQTKNAMFRYKVLDRLLKDKYHNYSLNDLTEEVCDALAEIDPDTNGITRRAIEKDIYFLENENEPQAEIERYTVDSYDRERQKNVKKHCLRYADQSFSIFNYDLNDEERELLSGALSLLGNFQGLPNLNELETLRWKVQPLPRRRKIISISKNSVEYSNILGKLFNVITQKQVIRITYQRFKTKEQLVFTVNPYLLKEFNRRWYLICKDYNEETIRNLPLDRIISIKSLPAYRFEPYDGDISKYYDDVIGTTYYKNNPLLDILFWISDESDDYVLTKPLHHSQRIIKGQEEEELRSQYPQLQGGTFFTIICRKNYELIRELTAYGKELIVLSPLPLQEEICLHIKEMCKAYETIK